MCWVVCWAHVLYGEVGAFCPLIQEEVSLGRFISFFCQCQPPNSEQVSKQDHVSILLSQGLGSDHVGPGVA